MNTISIEDKYFVPFFNKIPVSIERGKGVYVWDTNGITLYIYSERDPGEEFKRYYKKT